ncbi:Pectinesterase [Psidium guajava]|nr:Pectinesterase [Psidium guajava]
MKLFVYAWSKPTPGFSHDQRPGTTGFGFNLNWNRNQALKWRFRF